MALSRTAYLTWARDGADDEHYYKIPQLIHPRNLTEEEEDHEAVGRLEDEREQLIDEVLKLNNKLRDLARRHKELNDCVTSERKGKRGIQDSLTLATMNAHAADVDLFFGREPPANVPRNNEFQRLSKYLLGSSQESKY